MVVEAGKGGWGVWATYQDFGPSVANINLVLVSHLAKFRFMSTYQARPSSQLTQALLGQTNGWLVLGLVNARTPLLMLILDNVHPMVRVTLSHSQN